MEIRYFVLIARDQDRQAIRAALYDHSRVCAEERNLPFGDFAGRSLSVVQTTADTADRVEFLVNYQKGRLESFMGFYVDSATFASYSDVEERAAVLADAYPDMVQDTTPAQLRYQAAQRLADEFGDDVSEWTV